MSLPAELLEYLRDMRDTIEAQGQKIHELELRVRELESHARIEKKLPEKLFTLDPTLELVQEHDGFKLIRTDAGSTALAVAAYPMKKLSITCKGENKPQFVYMGLVDERKLNDGMCTMQDCYMLNSSGRGKIPGEQWQPYDEPMYSIIVQSEKFDLSISGGLNVMCDLGRNCCLFPKIPENPRLVVGIFGQGEVSLRVIE